MCIGEYFSQSGDRWRLLQHFLHLAGYLCQLGDGLYIVFFGKGAKLMT